MKLTENFSLKEMTKSQTAERHGISNNPSEDHQENLKKLCDEILISFFLKILGKNNR